MENDKINIGHLVKINTGEHTGEIGIITKIPNKDSGRDYYEIATEEWPYGEWYNENGFFELDDSNEEYTEEGKRIRQKRKDLSDELAYLPFNRNPRELLMEMAEIYRGYNKDHNIRNGFRVWIEPNEGLVPHVHVVFKGKNGPETAYVCLCKAEYLSGHDSRILNTKERKDLQRFFETEVETVRGTMTCWELAVFDWEQNIIGDRIKTEAFKNAFEYDDNGNMVMPDYTKLK